MKANNTKHQTKMKTKKCITEESWWLSKQKQLAKMIQFGDPLVLIQLEKQTSCALISQASLVLPTKVSGHVCP